jgi:hypothetical protein
MAENKSSSGSIAQLGVSSVVSKGVSIPTDTPLIGQSPSPVPVNQPSPSPAPPPKD